MDIVLIRCSYAKLSLAISFVENLLLEDPKMRMSLADALNHPWLQPLRQIQEPPMIREATVSPHALVPLDRDVSMIAPEPSAMSLDAGQPSSSPQNSIPGAYPSSQPERTLQRRRKVLDDAREKGVVPEPSPEMIKRVEQQQRREDDEHYSQASRPLKRKARGDPSSEAMVEDEAADAVVDAPAQEAPVSNGRTRRGKASATPASPAGPSRPRGRGRSTRSNDVEGSDAGDQSPGQVRRSNRLAPARGRK